jgi:hypothetical protein
MPEDNDPKPVEDQDPIEDDPKEDDPDKVDPIEDDPDPDEDDDKKLPEWAEKELKEVRAEAAGYRVKLREAIQKLEQAKSPEEYETAVSELRDENDKLSRQILINEIAREHELPKELADVLQGATEEELKAHAETLKKFAPPKKPKKKVEVSGGLTPDEDNDAFDPVALVKQLRSARR